MDVKHQPFKWQCTHRASNFNFLAVSNLDTNLVPRAFAMIAPTSQRRPWLGLVT